MAKKYIDAEAAIEKLCDRCGECLKAKGKDCAVVRIIDKVPAADVAEIRHAHWEIKFKWKPLAWDIDPLDWDRYDEKTHSEEVDYYACSKCGYDGGSWKPSWKYCPNCGARMDESEDENNV